MCIYFISLGKCELNGKSNFDKVCKCIFGRAQITFQYISFHIPNTYFNIKHFCLSWSYHSSDPPLPFFKTNLHYLPWKIKKKGWKYGAGAGLLKREGWHFSYLIFSRFAIFAFRNYFTRCKIVLCIWRNILFCHHNFMKKGHSKLSKKTLKISCKLI